MKSQSPNQRRQAAFNVNSQERRNKIFMGEKPVGFETMRKGIDELGSRGAKVRLPDTVEIPPAKPKKFNNGGMAKGRDYGK